MGVWLGLVRVAAVGVAVMVFCVASPTPLEEEEEDFTLLSDYEYSDDYEAEMTRSGLCVPGCPRDGAMLLDRTSCRHYFVCKKLRGELVLSRCSCPDERPVFNRYSRKCSRKARCRVSCPSHHHVFSNWTEITLGDHKCRAADLPPLPETTTSTTSTTTTTTTPKTTTTSTTTTTTPKTTTTTTPKTTTTTTPKTTSTTTPETTTTTATTTSSTTTTTTTTTTPETTTTTTTPETTTPTTTTTTTSTPKTTTPTTNTTPETTTTTTPETTTTEPSTTPSTTESTTTTSASPSTTTSPTTTTEEVEESTTDSPSTQSTTSTTPEEVTEEIVENSAPESPTAATTTTPSPTCNITISTSVTSSTLSTTSSTSSSSSTPTLQSPATLPATLVPQASLPAGTNTLITTKPATLPVTTNTLLTTKPATQPSPSTLPATLVPQASLPAGTNTLITTKPATLPVTTNTLLTTKPATQPSPATLPATLVPQASLPASTNTLITTKPATLPVTTNTLLTTKPATQPSSATLPATLVPQASLPAGTNTLITTKPATLPVTTNTLFTTKPATLPSPVPLPTIAAASETSPASANTLITTKPATFLATTALPAVLPAGINTLIITKPAPLQSSFTNPGTIEKPATLTGIIQSPVTLPTTNVLSTTKPATIQSPVTLPAILDLQSPFPQSSSPLPAAIQKPSTLPATVHKPSTLPATINKPSSLPAIIHKPSTLPAVIHKPSTLPAIIQSPSALPDAIQKPSTLPVTIQSPSPLPSVIQSPSSLPATIQPSATIPDITVTTTQQPDIPAASPSALPTSPKPDAPSLIPSTGDSTLTLMDMMAADSMRSAYSAFFNPTITIPIIPKPSFTLTNIALPTLTLPSFPKPTLTFPSFTKPTITLTTLPQKTFTIPILQKPSIVISTRRSFTTTTRDSGSGGFSINTVPSTSADDIPEISHTPAQPVSPNLAPVSCNKVACPAANARIPNPYDCNRYYKCIKSEDGKLEPRPFVCPATVPIFSPKLQLCVRGIKCKVSCGFEQPTNESSGLQGGTEESESESFQSIGETTSVSPAGESNTTTPVTEDVATDASKPTMPTCTISCTTPNMKIPDPRSCRFFYICRFTEDKKPSPIHVKCPSSRPVFSSTAGECVAKAPCVARCPTSATIVVTQDPLTPTPTNIPSEVNTTPAAITTDLIPSLPSQPSSSVDCQPTCLVPNSWLADPADCHYFYVCHFLNDVASEPKRIKCPPNRPIFDQTLGRCTEDAVCKISCDAPAPIATPDVSDPSQSLCRPRCVIPNSKVPDPSDCKHYYLCILMGSLRPQPIRSKCPEDTPFFDSSTRQCVEQTRCKLPCPQGNAISITTTLNPPLVGDTCSPRCGEPQTVVPDPRDCHHYYICQEGSPLSAIRMKCPANWPYFDSATTSCSELNTCKAICGENSAETTPDQASSPDTPTNIPDTSIITTTIRPGSCRPRCSSHNTIVHDPLDCHHYYLCSIVDGQPRVTRVKCPEDRPVFSLQSQNCQQDGPCIITCADNIIQHPSTSEVTTNDSYPSATAEDIATTTATSGSSNTPAESSRPFQGLSTTTENSSITEGPSSITDTSTACAPQCSKAGVLLADLSDCHRYFVCVYVDSLAPRPVRATCPQRTPVFDFSKKRCVKESKCYQPCANQTQVVTDLSTHTPAAPEQTPVTTTEVQSSTPTDSEAPNQPTEIEQTIVEVNECSPKCKEVGGLVPDPKDCRYYYSCSDLHGTLEPLRVLCPYDRPVFDPENLQCSNESVCVVTCSLDITQAPQDEGSTNECTHVGYFAESSTCLATYTHCYQDGGRLVKVTKHCPPGLVFNSVATHPYCVAAEDCPYDPTVMGPAMNTTSCRHPGSFPRCSNCCSDFLRCEASGNGYTPVAARCPGGLVFNTDPRYPVCVRPQDCPRNEPANGRCEEEGYYPACQGCCKHYYHCTGDGRLLHHSCPHPLLFNPDPSHPYCVLPWKCPSISPGHPSP